MTEFLDVAQDLILPDPETGGLKATEYFEDFLYQIASATGAESSNNAQDAFDMAVYPAEVARLMAQLKRAKEKIVELERLIPDNQNLTGIKNRIKDLDRLIPDHQSLTSIRRNIKVWTSLTKTEAYTLRSYEFVNAKSGAIMTFPESPDANDLIKIRNGDGSCIGLQGNGRNINGNSSGALSRQGTLIEFQYFKDSDEWFAT